MKVYHVKLEQEDGWFVATAMEDQGVFTQGRTLDEVVANVREVAALMYDERDVHVELVVPSSVSLLLKGSRGAVGGRKRPSSKPVKARAKVA